MFAKLWRWATVDDIRAAAGLNELTKRWLLKRMTSPVKPTTHVGIFPLPKDRLLEDGGVESFSDPDADGIVWFINGPEGPEEWLDPLPDRVLKEGAYRYDGRLTFFNDDLSCPDLTGYSGSFVTRGFVIKYPRKGDPRMDEPRIIAEVTRAVRAHADEVRATIDLQVERARLQRAGHQKDRAVAAGGTLAGLAIRCGDCRHPPEDG